MAVYPCVYREHYTILAQIDRESGLSLCVQGTLDKKVANLSKERFIPVCTGNTSITSVTGSSGAVYPCVYREHCQPCHDAILPTGLSLCVQGTLIPILRDLIQYRFIPVCTGNTPIITYCFIIKILTTKFLPIFLAIFYQNQYL